MSASSLIFNRTSQDVKNAAKIREDVLKEFQTPTAEQLAILEKGFVTYNTINRIESKQAELMESLQSKGYWQNDISTKADWDNEDVFYQVDLDRIIANLAKLKLSFFVYATTPSIPEAVLHYDNFNAIEKILFDIDEIIAKMVAEYKICGDYVCGG